MTPHPHDGVGVGRTPAQSCSLRHSPLDVPTLGTGRCRAPPASPSRGVVVAPGSDSPCSSSAEMDGRTDGRGTISAARSGAAPCGCWELKIPPLGTGQLIKGASLQLAGAARGQRCPCQPCAALPARRTPDGPGAGLGAAAGKGLGPGSIAPFLTAPAKVSLGKQPYFDARMYF